jgi:hypothetical protein
VADVPALLKSYNGGKGFDDVYVYAPVPLLVEMASSLLGYDGLSQLFCGRSILPFPPGSFLRCALHNAAHVAGNSGGNTDDLMESLELMAAGAIDPAAMITTSAEWTVSWKPRSASRTSRAGRS